MRIVKSIALLLIIILVFTGCSISKVTIVKNEPSEKKLIQKAEISIEDKIYTASNQMGIQMLRRITAENKAKNVIFSPASLSTILAVINNGADGKTREQINLIINPNCLSIKELNEKYYNIINLLKNSGYEESENKTTLIELANSLLINNDLKVKDNFLNKTKKWFGAEAYNIDFSDDKAINDMNRWIEDKTHGKIKDYAKKFIPEPALVAFNALYFNGKWQNPFDKSETKKEDFHLKNGETVQVDMMNGEKRIDYYEDNYINAGKFNYYGCNMLVILPEGDISEYVKNLDYEDIQKVYGSLKNMKVKIKFPKFTYKQKNKLNDHLIAMGMKEAFDSANADFTEIAEGSNTYNLFISDVSQECFIGVDEEGTEAAALTSVALCGGAIPEDNVPPEFYLNKPFLYVISEDRTGLILFAGIVENPKG